MTTRASTSLTIFFASLCLMACSGESTSTSSTPATQSVTLAQVSAGGGASGYDLHYNGNRVGALLVTGGTFGGQYADEWEYWRWDPASLADLADGDLSLLDIEVTDLSTSSWSEIVSNFESGTSTWTSWDISRSFDPQSQRIVEWNQPSNGVVLYRTDADPWPGMTGTVRYYLKLDFNYAQSYPEMTWYVRYSDYEAWQQSPNYDPEDTGLYEVRLRDDGTLNQTVAGVGYELKTVK